AAVALPPSAPAVAPVLTEDRALRRARRHPLFPYTTLFRSEVDRIQKVAAELNVKAPISLRVNPDVDAKTHPYISTGLKENKFGIAIETALAVYQRAAALPSLDVVGVDCHIGSQITEVSPYLDALDKLIALIETLAQHGIHLKHLDLGGGIGIRY